MNKIFKFRQSVDFGEAISLIVKSNNIDEAKKIIFDWITENTKNEEESYNKSLTYWKERIKEEKQKIINIANNDAVYLTKNLNNKILCLNNDENIVENFSINDFEENSEVYIKFAQHDSKRTYIWWFLNKEYELEELIDNKCVISSEFIYEGK
jgi:hypothetical protein